MSVIAVDLPPFGLSDRPRAENYATSDQGKRIAATLDTLEVREAVLVGHSFGARATVEAVLLSPSRVRALGLDLAFRRGLLRSPPPETIFLHRKLVGSFLLLARIGARVDARALVLPFLPAR